MRPELDDTMAAATAAATGFDETALPLDPLTAPASPAALADRTATAAPRASAAPTGGSGLRTGQQLGHFRIERALGAGGMGEVYLATDLALERPVAIKVLPEDASRDPGRRERLVREARAQARVTHPNVGHIYFIGEEAGRLYFAMEYVAGETLSARVANGPLLADDALAIIRSAALGLREAQKSGITHRDIKPSNLMIDHHGMVKVLDFGLAASAPVELAGDGATDAPVAQTTMAGTPLYMAPEQARGEPVDCRADIYALGATLFHLVAGRPPFEADSLDALLTKHSSATRPNVPRRAGQARTTIAAVDALCSRMMAPAASDRFASYDELIRALELASVEHMRPAGFWVRSMSALVDLLLATLVAGAIAGVTYLAILALGLDNWFAGNNSLGWLAFSIYVAGAIALIARRGRTFGQALFELEVIDVNTGQRPSWPRAAFRVALPVAVPVVEMIVSFVLDRLGYQLYGWIDGILTAFLAVPPIGLLWASLRSVSKQTIWDRRSGTVVRYRMRRQAV
jgi:predicted Ser/Thr protein kinase